VRSFFTRLYGNEKNKAQIGTAILSDRLNHALLICGPEGSGKATLALEISAALNCENKKSSSAPLPCGQCNTCRRILDGNYTDVKILKRDPSKATIGVEELRLFREDMFLSATESDYKVYIIEDADKMTVNAQNALLKVLEEPPSNVIMLLLAEEGDRILTTVKSRSQFIAMQRFSAEELLEYFKNFRSGALQARDSRILENLMGADGRIGKAIEILENPTELEAERKILSDIISAIRTGATYSDLYLALSALPQKRAELTETLQSLLLALSDLIKIKFSDTAPLTFFAGANEIKAIASGISPRKLLAVYDAVTDAIEDNSKNVNISALITGLGAKIKLI
jgi:DNA polymerase-3 subunit delta'